MAKAKRNSKKKMIFIIFAGLILLIVVMAIIAGNKEDIIFVQVEKVQKRTITETVTANGKIFPIEQVVLRPEVNGEIVELPVEEGDKVKKGDLLIKIKQDQYIARKNRALASLNSAQSTMKSREATLVQVESEYNRIKNLAAKGLASDKELELAKANYLQTKNGLDAQKAAVVQAKESYKDALADLAKTTIYSPLDGTISQLNVELSERVLGSSFSQGTHLMTVADLGQMEARVDVDENDVVRISVGDTAKIQIDAFKDRKFMGIVTRIGNSAKTSGLGTQNEVVNFEIRIKIINLPSDLLRPGMSCDAEIRTETRKNVLTVPIQSVTVRMDDKEMNNDEDDKEELVVRKASKKDNDEKPQEIVFIVKENRAKAVNVKTGISSDEYFEIVEGLKGNEKVVSGPYRAISKQLEDGKLVSIQKKYKKNTKKIKMIKNQNNGE